MTLNRLTILSLAILTCMFCWDAFRWESGWFMVGALAALVALIDVALESSMSDCDYPRRTDSMPPWVVRAWTIRTLAFAAWSFLLFWEAESLSLLESESIGGRRNLLEIAQLCDCRRGDL